MKEMKIGSRLALQWITKRSCWKVHQALGGRDDAKAEDLPLEEYDREARKAQAEEGFRRPAEAVVSRWWATGRVLSRVAVRLIFSQVVWNRSIAVAKKWLEKTR